MSSLVFETSLVNTEGYDTIRKGENVPLRDLDNFVFYTKRKKGTRFVSIEDIEEGEPIYGRGRLMPKKGTNKSLRAIEIELDILDSWALEFCDKLEDSGVWIKTNYGWYRLLNPAPEYKFLYEDLHARFEITLKVFAVLVGPNGSNMLFKDMARELKARHGITDKELIDNAQFIAKHLRSVERLDRYGFVRSLEITHAFYHKGLYKLGSAYTSKKKRTFNDVKAESSRAKRSNMNLNVEKHADESSDSEEHSKTKRRKITHHTNNTPTINLFVTKSRQYHGVKDYSTIPQRYLSEDKKSLHCFVCDHTMRVEDIEQYVKHVTKHRSNLVGEMLDKDRVVFRLQSFINQTRVRSFIETSLATDTPMSEDVTSPLVDLPSQIDMTMKARKRRNFYVDERPAISQVFEAEHQPLYNEFHREEEIEEMVVDSSSNYKTVPTSNRYGDISEAQEFEEEIVDEDDEDYEQQHVYVPYSRDEEDDDEDEDEDFHYKPKTKPKPKRRSGSRAAQHRFASAQQLEKERQKREQKENNRAIEALEILVAREILDAVETLPAIEMNREATLRQDLSMLLLPSSHCTISPAVGHMTNESNMSNDSNSEIESRKNSLEGASEDINALRKGNNSPNIALCNEVMVKQ